MSPRSYAGEAGVVSSGAFAPSGAALAAAGDVFVTSHIHLQFAPALRAFPFNSLRLSALGNFRHWPPHPVPTPLFSQCVASPTLLTAAMLLFQGIAYFLLRLLY